MPGSGNLVSSIFEKSLLRSEYQLVERREIEKILKEQELDFAGGIDPRTAKKIGHLLGVDALILGNITVFTPEKKDVVYIDIHEAKTEPIIQKEVQRVKQGDKWIEVERDVVKGYTSSHKAYKTPQTYVIEAEVGMAVRMVEVETGEILWVGSTSEEALNTQTAAEHISRRIIKDLRKQIREEFKSSQK